MDGTGVVWVMHALRVLGVWKAHGYTEQNSGGELIEISATSAELPHGFLTNVQNFQAEASLWVTLALMSGFFERYAKIRAAVFETSSTWLTFLLDECEKAYELYRNDLRNLRLQACAAVPAFGHSILGYAGSESPPCLLR